MSMPSLSIATALVFVGLVQGNAVRPHWAAAPVRHRRSERLWRREGGHDHGDETCGCAGGEADHPFTINCTDPAPIRAAATTLEGCTATVAGCKDATPNGDGVLVCNQAFLILQAHHDYCEHDTLLTAEELQVHDFEAVCVNCKVDRVFDANQPECAALSECQCKDAGMTTSNATAALAVLASDCTVNGACCASTATQDAFRTVVAYHDRCDHELVEAVEDGLHNYEDACESYFCRTATAVFDPNFCAADTTTTPAADTNTTTTPVLSTPDSNSEDSAASAGAEAFPALVLVLGAALLF